jgi:hypothetical protein
MEMFKISYIMLQKYRTKSAQEFIKQFFFKCKSGVTTNLQKCWVPHHDFISKHSLTQLEQNHSNQRICRKIKGQNIPVFMHTLLVEITF